MLWILTGWWKRKEFETTKKQLEYALEHKRYITRLEAELRRIRYVRRL